MLKQQHALITIFCPLPSEIMTAGESNCWCRANVLASPAALLRRFRRFHQRNRFPCVRLGQLSGTEAPDYHFFSGEIIRACPGAARETHPGRCRARSTHPENIHRRAKLKRELVGKASARGMHVTTIVKNEHMAVAQNENRTRTVRFHASGLALRTHEALRRAFPCRRRDRLEFPPALARHQE